jgi:hypothetical protein
MSLNRVYMVWQVDISGPAGQAGRSEVHLPA